MANRRIYAIDSNSRIKNKTEEQLAKEKEENKDRKRKK